MNIMDYLKEDCVFLDKAFGSKDELFDFLIEHLKDAPQVIDIDSLRSDLLEREEKGGTGLENGIALPHARSNAVSDILICFIRLGIGLDFGAPDGKPSKLVFFIAVPKDRIDEYLEIVGHIMRILKRDSVREKIMSAETKEDVLSIFKELEVK